MLEELIKAADIREFAVSERMKVYEASFCFDAEKSPDYIYFSEIIQSIPQRDKIKITLQDENENVFDFSSVTANQETYKTFIEKVLNDEIVVARIQINKSVEETYFSIYAYEEFAKDILSLSIENVMIAFSEIFKQSPGHLFFDVFNTVSMFTTKTMFFVPHGNNLIDSEFNRTKRIEECKEVSYFYNFDRYEVLPDDFKIDIDYADNPLSELFQRITTLLSISFIASSATISSNQLKGVINGQRTMEYCCSIKKLPNNKMLYRIYNWIYTDGNSIDKAIIARNVISLHCKYSSIIELDEKVMASIQSNYNLYLKDNVTQYLELKNKVAEFISEIVSRTGEYAMGMLDKFKANLITIFGFIFTVILANIVSSQPLDNLFTGEITVLIECVLFGSFIYLIICHLQSRYEIKKVYESYEKLKKNYNKILTEEDLLEVFGNDEMLKELKETIKTSKRIFISAWIVFLLCAFIIIEIISTDPSHQHIYDFIKSIIANAKG